MVPSLRENHHEISLTPLVLKYHLCIPQSPLTIVQLSTMGNIVPYNTVEAAGGRVYRLELETKVHPM